MPRRVEIEGKGRVFLREVGGDEETSGDVRGVLGVVGGHGGSEGLDAFEDGGVCFEDAEGDVGGEALGEGLEATGGLLVVHLHQAVSKLLLMRREGGREGGREGVRATSGVEQSARASKRREDFWLYTSTRRSASCEVRHG